MDQHGAIAHPLRGSAFILYIITGSILCKASHHFNGTSLTLEWLLMFNALLGSILFFHYHYTHPALPPQCLVSEITYHAILNNTFYEAYIHKSLGHQASKACHFSDINGTNNFLIDYNHMQCHVAVHVHVYILHKLYHNLQIILKKLKCS